MSRFKGLRVDTVRDARTSRYPFGEGERLGVRKYIFYTVILLRSFRRILSARKYEGFFIGGRVEV